MSQFSRKGFSLVELLIATVVLVTAMMGILMMFSRATGMVNQEYEITLVNNILQDQVEQLRSQPLSTIVASFFPSGAIASPALATLNNASGTVTIDFPFADNNIARASVSVTWTMAGGRVLNKSTATYITDQGINRE